MLIIRKFMTFKKADRSPSFTRSKPSVANKSVPNKNPKLNPSEQVRLFHSHLMVGGFSLLSADLTLSSFALFTSTSTPI